MIRPREVGLMFEQLFRNLARRASTPWLNSKADIRLLYVDPRRAARRCPDLGLRDVLRSLLPISVFATTLLVPYFLIWDTVLAALSYESLRLNTPADSPGRT